ncbi:MAG: prephenate dehydratase [Actinomycetales bacterium]|nr:prephenate dehydratase [Actinomycetales bacterium]
MRIAYLGPEGTFTEEALRQYSPDAEAVACVDVPTALDLARQGEAEFAVVPIENSVEGGVNATLDSLAHGTPLMIVGEVVVPIAFTLVVRPGTRLEDVRTVGTHPHAWAQCRRWMRDNLPAALHVPVPSTAAGAAALASGEAEFDAGLCSRIAVDRYGLEALVDGIADTWNAVTRFVVVSTPRRLPRPTGADKTTLMVHLAHNEAGGLLAMLQEFAVRGVNLSRIESRPIGDTLGRYGFSIDAEGHVAEERMQDVLMGLHRACPLVRFMGSYPSADGVRTRPAPGTSDADFIAARTWVRSLLQN